MYDEKFITFLRDFTFKALESYHNEKSTEINMSESHGNQYEIECDQREADLFKSINEHLKTPLKGLTGSEKLYGIPILWELV